MSWWGEFPPRAASPSQSGRPDAGAVSGYAGSMSPDQQPTNIQLAKRDDYRDNYANSVQVRMTMWDFFLTFGVMSDANSERVLIEAFQGVYLSPQQAKALANILNQNIVQYESAFGEIRLEPQSSAGVIQ